MQNPQWPKATPAAYSAATRPKRGHHEDRKRCADMLRKLRKCVPSGMSRRGWYQGVAQTVENYLNGMAAMRRAQAVSAEDRALAAQFAGPDDEFTLRSDLAYEKHKRANPHGHSEYVLEKAKRAEALELAARWGCL